MSHANGDENAAPGSVPTPASESLPPAGTPDGHRQSRRPTPVDRIKDFFGRFGASSGPRQGVKDTDPGD